MIDYNIRINLQGERTQYENITFTAGDSRGYCLRFAFYSYGARLDATGYTLAVKAKRADGQVIVDSGVTDEDGARYVVADNAIGVAGDLELEVALLGSDASLVTTAVICCYVRDGFGDGDLSAENTSPVLATLTQQAIQAAEAASRAEAAVEEVKAETQTAVDEAVEESKTYADAAAEGAVQTVRNEAANAFIGSASGAAVRFDDVSPVGHEPRVSVRSKNLLELSSEFYTSTNPFKGVSFTYNGDGTVTANGTAESDVWFGLKRYNFAESGVYVLSGAPEGAGAGTYFLYFGTAADYGAWRVVSDITGEKTLGIVIKQGVTVENLIFKPQLELGTVATEFVPYADVSGAHVLCCGRNLLNMPYELTVTNYQDVVFPVPLKAGVAYTVCFDAAETDSASDFLNLVFRLGDGKQTRVYMTTAAVGYTITPVKDVKNGRIFSDGYSSTSGVTATISGFRLYVAAGDEVLPYAPYYVEPVSYAVNEDGSVSGVMSLSPDMTLMTDTEGLLVDCTYHRDSNAVYEELVSAILSLGGNV